MKKSKKSIVIPPIKRGRPSLYDFDALKVGDTKLYDGKKVSQVNSAYQQYKKSNPDFKIVMRTEKDGCRVWRVKP